MSRTSAKPTRAHRERHLASLDATLPARVVAPERYIPHEPTPKQREFLSLDCLEALYGGAAGGGKTDALLMAAAQYVDVPGYAALLLRRTYADLSLPNAVMDRAKQWWIPQGVPWDEKTKRFTFPSGATITFGYLDTEQDRYRYQGAELQFIGFDELTQFPEVWYRYLLSRLRRLAGVTIPVRARSASNPGGLGHDWVRRRFIDGGGAHNDFAGRVFVPAALRDNPHLDAESYALSLAQLDPVTRRQLLEGVWIRDGGGLVYRQFDESRNLLDALPGDDAQAWTYLLGIDFGFVDSTAFAILAWRKHDPCVYVVRAWKQARLTPTEVAEHVRALPYRFVRIVGDTGGLGKGYSEEMRKRYSIPVEPADKENKLGFIDLLNGALADGRLKLVKRPTEPLQREWLELPWHESRQKEADGFENHCADACLYAWRAANAYHQKPESVAPAVGTPEYYAAQEAEILKRITKSVENQARARRGGAWWE